MMSSQILENNKIYLKTFLIDYSSATNGMRLVKNGNNLEKKFLNKDVILTPDKNHPPEFTKYRQTGKPQIDIPNFLNLQKKYRVGKIVEVNQSLVQGSNELVYTALIELDTDKGRNLFRHGLLPKYVSASIYKTKGEGFDDIQDFETLHLALVSSPAYGFYKARVRGSCENTQEICSERLAQAGLLVQGSTPRQKRRKTKLEELRAVIEFTIGRKLNKGL